jgi:Family of unknown function (DUF5338)
MAIIQPKTKGEKLSVRIAAREVTKKPSPYAINRAAFLALRPDIKDAMADGWNVMSIWETLHEEGKVSFGYEAFRKYVNRLILLPPLVLAATELDVANAQNEPSVETGQQPMGLLPKKTAAQPPQHGGFVFDPEPKKEDLF